MIRNHTRRPPEVETRVVCAWVKARCPPTTKDCWQSLKLLIQFIQASIATVNPSVFPRRHHVLLSISCAVAPVTVRPPGPAQCLNHIRGRQRSVQDGHQGQRVRRPGRQPSIFRSFSRHDLWILSSEQDRLDCLQLRQQRQQPDWPACCFRTMYAPLLTILLRYESLTDRVLTAMIPPTIYYGRVALEVGKLVAQGRKMTVP